MWANLFSFMIENVVRKGSLVVRMPDGSTLSFGDATPPEAHVEIRTSSALRKIILFPELAFGETYMNGEITVPHDDLDPLMSVLLSNMETADRIWWQKWHVAFRKALRRFLQNNAPLLARKNVAHHYDLASEFYDLFLDEDRQYSCAYFERPDDTLETAQQNKKHHIARKLQISPGMRVLDIGCGWGGLALTLARDYGAKVTAITLSEEQLKVARERVAEHGLQGQIECSLTDYRDVGGVFDRIVSVGMFEHVGLPQFDAYFQTVRNSLTPDGVALIHTIGATNAPLATNPWIAKYIFPGGYIPSLSEVAASIERQNLRVTDIEFLWMHYAETIRHWRERFEANAKKVEEIYDARFVRMWRFYLTACEQTFRHRSQTVFQFQITRTANAVPMTRTYMYGQLPPARLKAAE